MIYLKTKYSNDDKRFKIDERFVENEDTSVPKRKKQKPKKESDDDSCEEDLNIRVNDDNDNDNDNNDVIRKTNRKQIKSENLNSLKILEQITGKQLIRPKGPESDADHSEVNKKQTSKTGLNKMVRYDPTKDEHKIFEIAKEEASSDEETASKSTKQSTITPQAQVKIEEDLSKFYEIEPNIKDLFSSNDVFKFKFANDDKDESENEDLAEAATPIQKLKDFNPFEMGKSKKSKYALSSSEDEDDADDYEDEDEKEKSNLEKEPPRYKDAHKIGSKMSDNFKSLELPTTFLPDFANNKDIKEGLAYFFKVEKSREEWSKKREILVKVKPHCFSNLFSWIGA